MTVPVETPPLCPRCGGPVYGERTIHDCCARVPEGERCGACAVSRAAAEDWLKRTKICSRCGNRARFPGRLCRTCTSHDQEEGD